MRRLLFLTNFIGLLMCTSPSAQAAAKVPAHILSQAPAITFWNDRAKQTLSRDQMALLVLARQIGDEDDVGELLQGIILNETNAGRWKTLVGDTTKPYLRRSFGVAQVKIIAAEQVLAAHPELGRFKSRWQLANRLLTDHEFNLQVASKYLAWLRSFGRELSWIPVAYNMGPTDASKVDRTWSHKYAVKLAANITRVVRPFNQAVAMSGALAALD